MKPNNILLAPIKSFFVETGELAYFAGRFFREIFRRPFEFKELLKQCYNMGNRSMLLVGVTGFIIGLVFTLQSRPKMIELGAVAWLPSMVSISIIREIGPIITALICAGRIGCGPRRRRCAYSNGATGIGLIGAHCEGSRAGATGAGRRAGNGPEELEAAGRRGGVGTSAIRVSAFGVFA